MKIKFNFMAVLTAVLMTLSLVSCGDKPDVPGSNTTGSNATKCNLLAALYGGNVYSHYTNMVRFILSSGDIAIGKTSYEGSGTMVVADICADVTNDYFPNAGTYKIANINVGTTPVPTVLENGMAVPYFALNKLNYGCYIATVENGNVTSITPVTEGEVKVSGTSASGQVILSFKSEDGKTATYTYQGVFDMDAENALDAEDSFKGYENERKTKESIEFTYAQIKDYGDQLKCGLSILDIMLTNEEELWGAEFRVYMPADAEEYDGTYTIGNAIKAYSADRTTGADADGKIYAPYVSVLANEGGQLSTKEPYFIESGTIVIKGDEITFNVTSHYGSVFKGSFQGKISYL